MRKGQNGFAVVMVLTLLALGTLMVVPALYLVDTALKGTQVVTRQVMALYAADAAEEYVIWQLAYQGLGSQFTTEGQTITFPFNLNDTPVNISVIMRAVAGQGTTTLATQDKIRPAKSVVPNAHSYGLQTYTYTITLTQTSNDTSQGLDQVYDILPKGFGSTAYITGSSCLSVDSGPCNAIPNPSTTYYSGEQQLRLRWPASGNFVSPIRDFAPGQVKKLSFQVSGTLSNNANHCNWVVLKPWNTLSGPQAPISVGSPPNSNCPEGIVQTSKTSNPEVIQPGVATSVQYTISITSNNTSTMTLLKITDYLPPGFSYCSAPFPAPAPPAGGVTDAACQQPSGITTAHPTLLLQNINGVDRWRLEWTMGQDISPGQTRTQTFWSRGTKDVSGSYFNEVLVQTDETATGPFEGIGVGETAFGQMYSWNTGTVIVPAYDARAEAPGVTIDVNLALALASISIQSWQVR